MLVHQPRLECLTDLTDMTDLTDLTDLVVLQLVVLDSPGEDVV